MTESRKLAAACGAVGLALCAMSSIARADDDWRKTVKFSGYVEAGGTGNTASPDAPPLNWGFLFTDKDNQLLVNQLSFIISRDADLKKQYDLGFKFQYMYGTDARYTHFLGELDKVTDALYQMDIVEAWLLYHTPWLGTGGTDFKIGQYVTLEGTEVIDPRGNFFYSHSYIFNFGIPFKHTGVLAETHVHPMFDLYYGIDTGVNTTFGHPGDPTNSASFHGGFGLNLLKGDLTVLATTHIGKVLPETGPLATQIIFPGVEVQNRYLNDITVVYKVNKKLTVTYDFNYILDDTPIFGTTGKSVADGFGIASYWVYSCTDNISLGFRNEWWRDEQGAFVAAFPGNLDFVNAQEGQLNTSLISQPPGKGTNYYALTAGLNWKPEVPKDYEGMVVRPEIRWDHSTDTRPFNDFTDHNQYTIAADVIVPFTFTH